MIVRLPQKLVFPAGFAVFGSRQDAHTLWSPVAAGKTVNSQKSRPRQDRTALCSPVAAEIPCAILRRSVRCSPTWPQNPTNILIINVLHISFCPRRNRKKDVTRRVYMPRNPSRQTGARQHALCMVMRKVSVRQTPKSAYGAQFQEIHR